MVPDSGRRGRVKRDQLVCRLDGNEGQKGTGQERRGTEGMEEGNRTERSGLKDSSSTKGCLRQSLAMSVPCCLECDKTLSRTFTAEL